MMENPVKSPIVPPIAESLSTNFAEVSFKSLQERFEVRNGQTQARVIMSESGSSKLCIPPQLVQGEKTFIILKQLFKTVFFLGLATFLKLHLTPAGLAGAGSSLASYTRKLISKSCSRSQEKRNLENKITRTKK